MKYVLLLMKFTKITKGMVFKLDSFSYFMINLKHEKSVMRKLKITNHKSNNLKNTRNFALNVEKKEQKLITFAENVDFL